MHSHCRWRSGFKIAEWNGSVARRHSRRLVQAERSKKPEARGVPILEVTSAWMHRKRRRNLEERFRKVQELERTSRNLCIDLTWSKKPTKTLNSWETNIFRKCAKKESTMFAGAHKHFCYSFYFIYNYIIFGADRSQYILFKYL